MPKIPGTVLGEPISDLTLLRRGKVRDTYELPDHPGALLVVASDRISIFDFVLNALVPHKGEVLTAMNVFWRFRVLGNHVPHDVSVYGQSLGAYLPERIRDDARLLSRATLVHKLEMLPVEAIVRGYLTGSGWSAYRETGMVCGHVLPNFSNGYSDGDKLQWDIFTPTDKAEEGHDTHRSADEIVATYGFHLERVSLQLYAVMAAIAAKRGIILADTKFEFGRGTDGRLTLGDEVATPDSSRFWDYHEWRAMRRAGTSGSPTSFDKQYVREWGKGIGINRRDPLVPGDVDFVQAQTVPADVIKRTSQIYRYIFWRLTGQKLEVFQDAHMRLKVQRPTVRIEVVTGSESDLAQMREGLDFLNAMRHYGYVEANRHVVSCHRNPQELAQYAALVPDDAVIVAGAGLAAALPGVLKAHLMSLGKGHIPVIGVAFKGKTEHEDLAARLSIEQLPGRPVELDSDGKAYVGAEGFMQACKAALDHEFLPSPSKTVKPAQFNVPLIPA